jgi:hypothetical protein
MGISLCKENLGMMIIIREGQSGEKMRIRIKRISVILVVMTPIKTKEVYKRNWEVF